MFSNIAIIGSSGAIGSALLCKVSNSYPNAIINSFSSSENVNKIKNVNYNNIEYLDEDSLEKASIIASEQEPIDLVIVAIGILHYEDIMPEKSLNQMSYQKFELLFRSNAAIPAMIMKYFLPKLSTHKTSVLASLSARVGSISDNYLGGWYSYRASKSALNMIIKNASIEIARKNKNAVVIGLHPGTVDSNLSKPFQSSVSKENLFTPEYSSEKLLEVISCMDTSKTGKCFAWNGKEIFS